MILEPMTKSQIFSYTPATDAGPPLVSVLRSSGGCGRLARQDCVHLASVVCFDVEYVIETTNVSGSDAGRQTEQQISLDHLVNHFAPSGHGRYPGRNHDLFLIKRFGTETTADFAMVIVPRLVTNDVVVDSCPISNKPTVAGRLSVPRQR